jgi:hypothetical protein
VALGDLILGRAIAGWALGILGLPLVAGWMLQELVGSWTHLVPGVTLGDPGRHARQRGILATAPRARLAAWNVGLALLWGGLVIGIPVVAVAGGTALVAAVVLSIILLGRALTVAPPRSS